MLPYLQPKKIASVIIASRKPDGSTMAQHAEDEHDPGLMAACEDLISAVHSKDATKVASAIKACFDICDSQPHEEGPHPDEDMES